MRSAEAHDRLAGADPLLPSLAALLDEGILSERLGERAVRRYLRYKPGTTAIALVDLAGRAAIAQAWPTGANAKRAKALKHAEPADVLLDDPESGLLVVDAMTDRHLPALPRLVRSGSLGPWLARRGYPAGAAPDPTTLSHKPARRWVGRLALTGEGAGEHLVLRAYRPQEVATARAAHRLVDPGWQQSVRVPRVLGEHRHGLLVLEHLPGGALDRTLGEDLLHRLGAGLGQLHASTPGRLVGLDQSAPAHGLAPLAPALGAVLEAADRVAERARCALRPGAARVIHGDFSLDQVVADGPSLGIIDLDRARLGAPAEDLASLLAAAAIEELPVTGAVGAAALVDRLSGPLLAGHASTTPGMVVEDLGPRTALAVLARAGEPFRAGREDWPEVTDALVALAGQLATGRVAA